MSKRTAILGSLLVGMIAGAVVGLVLCGLFSTRIAAAYLFSVLMYGFAGGLGGLILSVVQLRVMGARRVVAITSGLMSGAFAFFALVYWGNRWFLAGRPFTSNASIVFDLVALAMCVLLGIAIGWASARGLSTPAGRGSDRPLGRWVLVVVVLCIVLPGAVLVTMGMGTGEGSGGHQDKPSVVLISVDALRADHLGCYGYPRRTSDRVDRLAAEGVKFEWTFCPAPSTGPSHATMLTGLTPQSHGLRQNAESLADSLVTLAEILSRVGYATGGFTTNVVLDKRFGFDQGFDTYVESGHVERLKPLSWSMLLQTLAAKEILDKIWEQEGGGNDRTILCAGKWLGQNRERPFFLFLHLLDPHDPYEPLEPYRSLFPRETKGLENSRWVRSGRDPETLARMMSLYDGEIAQADAKLGRFFRLLEEAGDGDPVLIVFTSDHGENLGNHEPYFRHEDVYDASLRVPLILCYPGVLPAGRSIHTLTENSGLVPTILSLVGLGIPEWVEGRDLSPLLCGDVPDSGTSHALAYSGGRYALRTDRWKVMVDFRDGRQLLYDLVRDPEEQNDIFAEQEEFGTEMAGRLLEEVLRREGTIPGPDEGPSPFENLDRATRERLRALGYVQ